MRKKKITKSEPEREGRKETEREREHTMHACVRVCVFDESIEPALNHWSATFIMNSHRRATFR